MNSSTGYFSSSPSTLSPITCASPNTTMMNISQRFQQPDYIKRNLQENLYKIQEHQNEHQVEGEEGEEGDENKTGNTTKKKYMDFLKKHLVVYKAFYFMFYGAVGSLFPYLAVFYKQLYLSAHQVGFLIGIRPFIQMATAPIWGAIADTYNVKKIILLMSIASWLGTNYSISLVRIPPSIACAVNETTVRIPPPGRITNVDMMSNITQTSPAIETGTKRKHGENGTAARKKKIQTIYTVFNKRRQKHKPKTRSTEFTVYPPRERRSDRFVTSVRPDIRSSINNTTLGRGGSGGHNSKISETQRLLAADELEEEFDAFNTDGDYPWILGEIACIKHAFSSKIRIS